MNSININSGSILQQFEAYASDKNLRNGQAVQLKGVGLRESETKNRNVYLDEERPLGTRTIRQLNSDHTLVNAKYTAGAFRRFFGLGTRDTEFANKVARTEFLNAVLAECGIRNIKMLDAGIKKALDDGDFHIVKGGSEEGAAPYLEDSGKPLTVRRIRAVIQAVKVFRANQSSISNLGVDPKINMDYCQTVVNEKITMPVTLLNRNTSNTDHSMEHFNVAMPKLLSTIKYEHDCRHPRADSNIFCEVSKSIDETFKSLSKNYPRLFDKYAKFKIDNAEHYPKNNDNKQKQWLKGSDLIKTFLGSLSETNMKVDAGQFMRAFVKQLVADGLIGNMYFLSYAPYIGMESSQFETDDCKFQYLGKEDIPLPNMDEEKDKIKENLPANFAVSKTLDKENKPTLTMLRCGNCITDNENKTAHYETIATEMILNNQMIMKMIEDSNSRPVNVPLPMFMFNAGRSKWPAPDDDFKFTVHIDGKEVNVRPSFHEFVVPGVQADDLFFENKVNTLKQANTLLKLAEGRFEGDSKMEQILKDIHTGIVYLKDLTQQKRKPKIYLQAYLCQWAARMAFLASKLGFIPSINCNHGRDRTGILGTLAQMCATSDDIPPLTTDLTKLPIEWKKKISEMLVDSGNLTVSLGTSIFHKPLNLTQDTPFVEYELRGLFDIATLNQKCKEKNLGIEYDETTYFGDFILQAG